MVTCDKMQTFRNKKSKQAMLGILFSFAVTKNLRYENFKCDKSTFELSNCPFPCNNAKAKHRDERKRRAQALHMSTYSSYVHNAK